MVPNLTGLSVRRAAGALAAYGPGAGRGRRLTIAVPGGEALRQHINTIEDCAAQWQAVQAYFAALGQRMDRLPATAAATLHEEQEGFCA